MNFNHPHQGDSTIVTKTMCAVAFLLFTFCWLYFFQADVLALAQHVLSGGQTHYDRLIGAVLITAVLWLLQKVVYALIRLKKRSHALSYLPSFLILAVVSDISTDIDRHFSLGAWWWVVPLVLLLWGGGVFLARGIQPYEDDRTDNPFSRRIWINMLAMAAMMLAVAIVGNTNAVFHFRAHAETSLLRHDLEEALRVGSESAESDPSLTMLRAYALSQRGELGDKLFLYPVSGTSSDLLLLGSEARTVIYPRDSFYRHLGALPRQGMNSRQYLNSLIRSGMATDAARDYVLCGHLVDRDLDAFAHDINRYYAHALNDSSAVLPRYYREALVLYCHMRVNPVVSYHDAVTDEDYENLQQLEAQHPDPQERKNQVLDKYLGSYWYYYEYCR